MTQNPTPDSPFALELGKLRNYCMRRALPRMASPRDAPVSAEFRKEIWNSAHQLQSVSGTYPISFGYLRPTCAPCRKSRWVSSVIPGMPYSYKSERRYRRQYAESMFGVTHKKGGWDCHRHLEILFAGAMPFMPDVDRLPEGSMHFYPTHLFRDIRDAVLADRDFDFSKMELELHACLASTLTAEAVAQYVWQTLSHPKRVYFLDFELHKSPDYLSLQLLAGLLRLHQPKVYGANRPMYLWRSRHSQHLYGRGFGYAGALGRQHEMQVESPANRDIETLATVLRALKVDALIVGSSHRHVAFCEQWLAFNDSSNKPMVTAFIDGGDERVVAQTNASDCPVWLHRFARELDHITPC